MKVNRTRSLTKAGMRKKNQTSNRPEEKLAYQMISQHIQNDSVTTAQKIVKFDDIHYAKLDIEIEMIKRKFAIRVMGSIHDERKNEDRLQRFKLEELGYTVIDLWYHQLPVLFERNKRKLDNSELNRVWFEISDKLFDYDIFLKKFECSESLQD